MPCIEDTLAMVEDLLATPPHMVSPEMASTYRRIAAGMALAVASVRDGVHLGAPMRKVIFGCENRAIPVSGMAFARKLYAEAVAGSDEFVARRLRNSVFPALSPVRRG